MKFSDLIFLPHPKLPGIKQARLDFKDGHWLSIVGGNPDISDINVKLLNSIKPISGDGISTFELLTSEDIDTKDFLTIDEINKILEYFFTKHGSLKAESLTRKDLN